MLWEDREMPNKSYWQEAYLGGERDKEAVKSWFGSMAEGLTPYKAELLCDIATDRNKKIRALMTDSDNNHFQLERTLGRTTFSVSRKRLPDPVGALPEEKNHG